jgi:CheY-like chemotaxis protein
MVSKVVMVVDDDEDIRYALSCILEDEGYRVLSVEHGRAALDMLLAGERPGVIFLDLMMPVMDGWAFRDEQKKHAELAQIPVVVITAAGRDRSSTIDADRVLQKPLSFDVVLRTVEEFC